MINISSTISIERQLAKIQENPQKALPEFWRNKTFLDNSSLAYAKLSSCFNGKITIIDGQLSTDDKLKQISGLNNEKILEKQLDLDAYLSLF
ncbi:MAG: hypothetical protein LBH96_01065 [Candidatus Peribacteria bacterium]|nr:hypothetical protein [Candidatus Peribacteria bacterium]